MSKLRYLLFCEGCAAIVEMKPGDSSEYYGRVQRAFAMVCGAKAIPGQMKPFAEMISLYDDRQVKGVSYDEELSGSGGMSFRLIKLPTTTAGQIAQAKAKLRCDRDVVHLSVVRVTRLVPFPMPPRDTPELIVPPQTDPRLPIESEAPVWVHFLMVQPYSKSPDAYNDVAAFYREQFRKHPLSAELKAAALHNGVENLLVPVLVAAQPSEAESKAILDMLELQTARSMPHTCLSVVVLLKSYTNEVGSMIGTGRVVDPAVPILLPKPSNQKGWQTLLDRCVAASPSMGEDAWLKWIRATSLSITEGKGIANGMVRKPWQEFKRPNTAQEATPEPEVRQRPFPSGVGIDI